MQETLISTRQLPIDIKSFPAIHGTSTEPVSDNGDRDLNLASKLDCEDRSINVSVNRRLSVPTSHEVEEPCEELEHPSNGSFTRDSDGKSQLPLLQPSHNSFLPLMRSQYPLLPLRV